MCILQSYVPAHRLAGHHGETSFDKTKEETAGIGILAKKENGFSGILSLEDLTMKEETHVGSRTVVADERVLTTMSVKGLVGPQHVELGLGGSHGHVDTQRVGLLSASSR